MKHTYGNFDMSSYEPFEVKTINYEDYTFHGQVKFDTDIKHGRSCEIFKNGEYTDRYYIDGMAHGPSLLILSTGYSWVSEYVEGVEKNRVLYNPDGTLLKPVTERMK